MQRMDWGDASDFVSFGNVGASCIDSAKYYVLVTPQNVVGNTIMTPLLEMVFTGGLGLHQYEYFLNGFWLIFADTCGNSSLAFRMPSLAEKALNHMTSGSFYASKPMICNR